MNAAVQTRGDKSKSTGILAGLNFSTTSQPKKVQADQRTPTQVISEWLAQQIGLVEAEIAGKPFAITKTRFKKDGQGKSIKTTVEVTPRRSYWQDETGKFFVALRYGNAIVNPVPNMTSVEAGRSLETVRSTFEALRKALGAGELDGTVQEAALAAKRRFASNKH
jgi:hypothetical protein